MQFSPNASADAFQAEPNCVEDIRKIANEGDPSALIALYDSTSSRLFGLVLRILRERDPAEEVLLDIYTQLWRHPLSFDPAEISPMARLMKIARLRAIDRRSPAVRDRPSSTTPDSNLKTRERQVPHTGQEHPVRSALDSLSPDRRRILELAYFDGLSDSEMAVRLEMPLGLIRAEARIAMTQLHELLQPRERQQTANPGSGS